MTDRRNNDHKAESFETAERSNRQNGRAPRREARPDRRRDGVAVYEQATNGRPAGTNLSWGSIFAGAVTSAACFATLSLITSALGFGLFSPTNANPLSGVGIGTGIWTAISLVISFLAGGFIAGYSARETGKLHGAITWALSLLLLLTLVLNAISSVLGTAANVAGNVASGAANVAGSAITSTGDLVGQGVSAGLDQASKQIGDVDTEELQSNIDTYLADTDIPELQPEYINTQLETSREEVAKAVKDIALNPNNADTVIKETVANLQERANEIANAADRDAIANAVSQNSDLTEAEAEQVTNNIYEGLQTASTDAQKSLDNAATEIDRLQVQAQDTYDNTVQNVQEASEDASNKLSAGSVITFLGLLAALALSTWGGKLGEEKARELVRKDTIR